MTLNLYKMDLSKLLEYLKNEQPSEYTRLIRLRLQDPLKFEKECALLEEHVEYTDQDARPINHILPELESIDLTRSGVRYINHYLDSDDLKTLSDQTMNRYESLIYYVDKGTAKKGKITNEIAPYTQSIKLCSILKSFHNGEEVRAISFFDMKQDLRKWKVVQSIQEDFWTYTFESGHRKYVLLSQERLDLDHCIIEGTLIDLSDQFQIGAEHKLNINLPILVVHTVTKSKIAFKDHEDFLDSVPYKGFGEWHNMLFSHERDGASYRHPQYFEVLISGFLLASKWDGYPLHLLVVARQGTGKSKLEEVLYEKFDEESDIVEGSCSTIKAIIPSFKGNLPEPGSILKSNKLCLIDEFLRILMRCDKDDREIQLSSLNPILEHKERHIASGNGKLRMKPTARVLAVTNPVWGTKTMLGLCDHIDRSQVSRWLVWYQDASHIGGVEEGLFLEDWLGSFDKNLFLSWVDYAHSFRASYERSKALKIFSEGLDLIKSRGADMDDLRDVYTARYRHHLFVLLDGIVKLRCMIEKDVSFTAITRDYEWLRIIWLWMLDGWGVVEGNAFTVDLLHRRLWE